MLRVLLTLTRRTCGVKSLNVVLMVATFASFSRLEKNLDPQLQRFLVNELERDGWGTFILLIAYAPFVTLFSGFSGS